METGLGIWTVDIFVAALSTGKHFGMSRPIMPPMLRPMARLRRAAIAILCGAWTLIGAGPAWSQTPDTGTLQKSLDRLNASLEKLVTLLDLQAKREAEEHENRRVEIATEILGVRLRKISDLEDEIKGYESEEETYQDELESSKNQLELLQKQRADDGAVPEEIRMQKHAVEENLRMIQRTLDRDAARVLTLQNDLASERKRVDGLEAIVEGWIEKLK